ncbi:hypothetical protein C2S53_007957 [Perilla frutescens var. hirtella]|uniref:Leucine-rich repeat-containing N-terminal plant-type domain-containing protein n=1 Tax=Perilla frutescens var. hirtella TaxID=608512 RepID=A0AAD4INE6_PERFH|nr:hypothetical protein C2S53_007957 [Perilla frutescens var. hirtella]
MAISSSLLRFFFLSIIIFLRINFYPVGGQCLGEQTSLLLDLKSELIFNSSYSVKLVRWNNDDCCNWDGVECDDGGRVISLQLDDESISGGIDDSSSSLFRLRYRQKLNLAYNHFDYTQSIPSGIRRLTHLRHLNLSDAGFGGHVPIEVSLLRRLVVLDISSNYMLKVEHPNLKMLIQNLTMLRELYLDDVDISAGGGRVEWCQAISSSLTHLRILSLRSCGLTGPFHASLLQLHSLSVLQLDWNNFSTIIPDFFTNLSSLTTLSLFGCSLQGVLPKMILQIPTLQELDLSGNPLLGGTIPQSSNQLVLSKNQFCGQVNHLPILNNSYMQFLDLSSNQLGGPIPHSFFQLQSLRILDLSDNLFNGLPNLTTHHGLSYNLSIKASSMFDLDLSNNRIAGYIPSWIWEIGNRTLDTLNLSSNLLVYLQKPYHIPTSLYSLDLHSNQLRGELPPLPIEICYVDYSNNNFDKTIPYSIFRNLTSIRFLSLANNSLSGSIPTPLCNATSLRVLNLSFNMLSNDIAPCLLEDVINENLQVLSLRGNNLDGVIPDQFSVNCSLRTLDLSRNKLGRKIPKSVANCKSLAVMNVGDNNFDGNFPCMLPSSLRILVLRSNKFYGELRCDKIWPNLQIVDLSSNNFSGSLLRVNFWSWRGMMLQSGSHLRLNHSDYDFLSGSQYYQDEVTLTIKGSPQTLAKIWPDFTSIDFSCNNFKGDIPEAIGNLSSLYHLNLSHNALASSIPKSLGALTDLESLDLSANRLRGRIPEELARLTFLSFLNLSHNELVGMIPNGPQFRTFTADSFEGNTGLCGFPLNRSCSISIDGNGISLLPPKGKDEEIDWDYVFAAAGYSVGLGSIVWILVFCRSFRERYFEKIEEVVGMIFDGRDRRRRQGRRRRRIVRRNEVIRRQ